MPSRELDGRQREHEVGDHRPAHGAADLGDQIGDRFGRGQAGEEAVGQGDDGVEVSTGDRSHGKDDRHQGGGRGRRVLEQLEAGVVRGQALGGDAGADNCNEQEGRADELGQRLPGKFLSPRPQQHLATSASGVTEQQPLWSVGSTVRNWPSGISASLSTV